MHRFKAALSFTLIFFSLAHSMELKKIIYGNISPKSIVHSGSGLFFAQNMMYRHSITVYNRAFELVKTIYDTVTLSLYGYHQYEGTYKGAPVEIAFSHGGKLAWVSNYRMYGKGFNKPGNDSCSLTQSYEHSYLYCIDTETFKIIDVIKVGSVPKFVAVSPDNKYVLVSNWCSGDVSIIETESNKEIKRVKVGRYPRGIAVDSSSEKAYVAVMGSYDIAIINLKDFTLGWFRGIGRSPRHLCVDPTGKFLFASLNGESNVAQIELPSGHLVKKVATGNAPRSMTLTDDGMFLYVVNYGSDTVSKIRTEDMMVIQTVKTNHHPIGITYDSQTKQIWVACYSGSIMVFQD